MKRKGEVARIRGDLHGLFEGRLPDRGRYRALLGDGAGNVRVTNRPNRVYARIEGRGQIREIINLKVPFRDNLPVIVAPTEEAPRIWEVVGLDKYTLMGMGDYAYLPPHHQAHEFKNEDGGDDVVWVRKQQHIPMLVYPTNPPSMILNVYQDWYQWNGELQWYGGGQTADLSAFQPVAPPNIGRYILVSLDLQSGNLQYTQGDDFNLYLPPSDMDDLIPTIPDDSRPLAAVLLRVVQTEISWNEIWDVRIMQGGTGTGQFGGAIGEFDNWLEVNATGTVSWAPDNVAILRNGVVTEYADPDDAFIAADTAGDVVLVPPGTWTLSANHALVSGVSVFGLGPTSDCILQATTDVGLTLLTIDGAEIANVTVNYVVNRGAGTNALVLDDAYGRNLVVTCTNLTGSPVGITLTDVSTLWLSDAYATGSLATAVGILAYGTITWIKYCYGYADGGMAGTGYGIQCGSTESYVEWCRARGNGLASGEGLVVGAGTTTATHCWCQGADWDISVAAGSLNVYSCQYDTLQGGLTQMAGDRTGSARNETITGIWTHDEEIIQKEQAAAPGGAAGYAKIYPRDDGSGQTKYYYVDDAGIEYELQGIIRDESYTVKPGGGGDFTTLQDAIDYLALFYLIGDITVTADAATYAENLDFSALVMAASCLLTFVGDARILAGLSYIDGVDGNRSGQAVAIAGTADSVITTVGNNGQPNITVTAAGANNPDFDADDGGWVNGDLVLVHEWAAGPVWTITQYTIQAAVNNVITLTGNLVNGGVSTAGVGDDGAGICLCPNRIIDPGADDYALRVERVGTIRFEGWWIKGYDSGASCVLVLQGWFEFANCLFTDGQSGVYHTQPGTRTKATDVGSSFWGLVTGVYGTVGSVVSVYYNTYVGCTAIGGTYTTDFAYLYAYKSAAVHCNYGFRGTSHSMVNAYLCWARHTTNTAYFSGANSYMYANLTNAKNNANGTDYSPAGAGYVESAANFGVIYIA